MDIINFRAKWLAKLAGFLLVTSIGCASARAQEMVQAPLKQRIGTVRVLSLTGTYDEMGEQYGRALESELKQALAILKRFYVVQHGVAYPRVIQQASLLYDRFPSEYQRFIQGVARGANIGIEDAKVLNGMETLGSLIEGQTARCAYLFVPGNRTVSHSALIGRNYDFPPPFDQLSQFLTVTVLHGENKIPVAFISMVGEVYCPTCINAKGLYLELNNGMPSGGFDVNQEALSLLASMLQVGERSNNLEQAKQALKTAEVDYSLIVNVANPVESASFEYSTQFGRKWLLPSVGELFVSTNYFLHSAWHGLPVPTDETTWNGVTRRKNLFSLVQGIFMLDVPSMEQLMDREIKDGGAVWPLTIYQLIYDSSDQSLYIKVNKHQPEWRQVRLRELFGASLSRQIGRGSDDNQ